MARPLRARLFCAVGVTLWTASTGAQPAALPFELRSHVQNGRFDVVTSVRGLPLGVRNEMQQLFGTAELDIAEPGAPLGASAGRPMRRLAAAGCSYTDCLVYYERVGGDREWRVMLFHWTPNATTLEWGGVAPAGLTTLEALRTAVVSGALKGATGPW